MRNKKCHGHTFKRTDKREDGWTIERADERKAYILAGSDNILFHTKTCIQRTDRHKDRIFEQVDRQRQMDRNIPKKVLTQTYGRADTRSTRKRDRHSQK